MTANAGTPTINFSPDLDDAQGCTKNTAKPPRKRNGAVNQPTAPRSEDRRPENASSMKFENGLETSSVKRAKNGLRELFLLPEDAMDLVGFLSEIGF